MSRNTYYWTCPYCGDNNDPGELCDCCKQPLEDYRTVREGVKSNMIKGNNFVCIDDISGGVEDMNYVIYNPTRDDPVIIPVKLFQHIKDRFGVELTPSEVQHLISYDEFHLTEFVHDLKKIIQEK